MAYHVTDDPVEAKKERRVSVIEWETKV